MEHSDAYNALLDDSIRDSLEAPLDNLTAMATYIIRSEDIHNDSQRTGVKQRIINQLTTMTETEWRDLRQCLIDNFAEPGWLKYIETMRGLSMLKQA